MALAKDSDGNIWFEEQAIYAGEIYYVPFLANDGRIGYVIRDHHGREQFIYLNPDDGERDRRLFLYIGDENSPLKDQIEAQHNVAQWPREGWAVMVNGVPEENEGTVIIHDDPKAAEDEADEVRLQYDYSAVITVGSHPFPEQD